MLRTLLALILMIGGSAQADTDAGGKWDPDG
jgi:hypothetical protein